MKETLIYLGLAALCAFVLYRIVKAIIESIKREQFRKRNRETQFSGSAVKEEKGFWASLFTPEYSSRAEAIGDRGEKRVSSFLEDLDSDEYRVYNDLLIRNGNYTTQVDHIVISRYGVFVLETKRSTAKYMAAAMQSSGSSTWRTLATNAMALPRNISLGIPFGRMKVTSRHFAALYLTKMFPSMGSSFSPAIRRLMSRPHNRF